MKNFQKNLEQLNKAQLQAVETLDGPVLVVAGPGTGKTQLLGMRAANIVQKTDAAPQNILCLTFTDSAAVAMRERLVALMGPEGNKVAVHTFHSFGTEVINQNSEFFYNGARFAPADDMASYEILNAIFKGLPHSNPLAKTMNGEFAALRDTTGAISHLKRAGLLPGELLTILEHNQAFYEFAEPLLAPIFTAGRLSKKDFPAIIAAVEKLKTYETHAIEFTFVKPIAEIFMLETTQALSQAQETGKTTAVTAWRNRWFEKNQKGEFVFKDRVRAKKLKALAGIYETYRKNLAKAGLFDFDDMVSTVAHTLEQKPELRFNLQEQYLYIMVDEFQDTNGAQLRLLSALAENPVNEDRPNILAVGDDDQAIYAFQGAELNNILDFTLRYRDVKVITLTENYRSTAAVLNQARGIITKAESRLETALQHVNKTLTPNKANVSKVELHQFEDPESEYQWVAEAVSDQIKNGQQAAEIAIIARNHKQLTQLLPHLHATGIATNYERRNNVLENPKIDELVTLATTVVNIGEGRFDLADALMPKLLSYDFWQLRTSDIWQLSLRAHKERRMWLELMLEPDSKLREIAEFLVICSQLALHEPLERMLDILIGANEKQAPDNDMVEPLQNSNGPHEGFVSPYRSFYFSEQRLKTDPQEYLTVLSGLRAIRQLVKNHTQSGAMLLGDFVDLIELHHHTETPIVDTWRFVEASDSVAVMTAHKAKGLEFGSVYIISGQDDIWGRRARHRSSSLSFPPNLPIEPAGTTYDDALRLFFVAITRAKQNIFITSHLRAIDGKASPMAEFLLDANLKTIDHPRQASPNLEQLTPGWEIRHLSLPRVKQADLLKPTLDLYKLSATHINNFIDTTRGGPQAFLLQNLLRFPQAMTPHQVYGYAVHAVLQRAHTHLSATGERRPVEDILHDYELQLQQGHLTEDEMTYWLQKGSDVLTAYLAERYSSFTADQVPERNFYGQDVTVAGVRLTGALDLMQINKVAKTIVVTDYKTGKPQSSWRAQDDFAKIKLHKYRQQLMLYKLLIEHSREYSGYAVEKGILEFVEPDTDNNLHSLELTFDQEELDQFKKMIQKIWQHIMSLDFPDTSQYPSGYKGILAFEQDLLKK